MFQRVIPSHKRFVTSSGEEITPIATLVDRKTAKKCYIALAEECYIVYIHAPGLGYVPTPYLFSEVHEVLADLPRPDTVNTHGDTDAPV